MLMQMHGKKGLNGDGRLLRWFLVPLLPKPQDVVKLGSINDNLPQNVKDAINTTYTKIKTGELKPFTGPLKDNTGKEVVAAGHSMTDAELAQINWFVEGIDATVAK